METAEQNRQFLYETIKNKMGLETSTKYLGIDEFKAGKRDYYDIVEYIDNLSNSSPLYISGMRQGDESACIARYYRDSVGKQCRSLFDMLIQGQGRKIRLEMQRGPKMLEIEIDVPYFIDGALKKKRKGVIP